jgi:hypothetical protein
MILPFLKISAFYDSTYPRKEFVWEYMCEFLDLIKGVLVIENQSQTPVGQGLWLI